MQQTADCVGVGLQQKILFSQFREIFNFVFHKIFLEFREISRNLNQKNFVKILCFAKFYNAVSQPPYVGVKEEEGGGSRGPGPYLLAHPPR